MRSDRVYADAAKGGWLLVGALLSCGPSQDGVLLINVGVLPERATKLTVKASLDGKTAMQAMDFSTPIDRFAVTPPQGTVGHLILNIQAFDADGCVQGSGQLDTTLTGQRSELAVAVQAQSPRICGTLKGCAAGTICAFTPSPVTSNLWGIWASSPTDIWAVGDGHTVLHYDGTTWTINSVPVVGYLNSVWGSSSSDVWAVGQQGSIIHYNGQTWSLSAVSTTNDLTGVYGVSATNAWAVGVAASTTSQGDFWHWDGSTWRTVTTGINGTMYSVWASAPNDITASGASGLLIHYNGTSWNPIAGTTYDLHSVWGVSANLVFAAGSLGTVLRFDGTSWKKVFVNSYSSILYAIGGDASTVYGVGNANATGNTIKGIAPFDTFVAQGVGSNDLTAVVVGSNGIGWASGKMGYLGYFDTRP